MPLEPLQSFHQRLTACGNGHEVVVGQFVKTVHSMSRLHFHTKAMSFRKETVDDGMRVLCSRKDTLVRLCHQRHSVTLKPGIGITIVERLEQTLHQSVAARIDFRQVTYIIKGIGTVTSSPTRHLDLRQHTLTTFQDNDLHFRHRRLEVDGQKEASRSATYYRSLHDVYLGNGRITSRKHPRAVRSGYATYAAAEVSPTLHRVSESQSQPSMMSEQLLLPHLTRGSHRDRDDQR